MIADKAGRTIFLTFIMDFLEVYNKLAAKKTNLGYESTQPAQRMTKINEQ
jgi:hypothetical protein